MRTKVTAPTRKQESRKRGPRRRPAELREIVASPGQPLDVGLRREMEERLGHDFSRVRIHTDPDAVALTELIGAEAVAVGQEVFFGDHAFHPETVAGRALLAHELMHTVQVPDAPGSFRLGRADGVLSQAFEPVEQEAEQAAHDDSGPEVDESGQQPASLLRYTTVTATQQRVEQIDPATIEDRLVAGLLRSLRGDPLDTSHRVQLQLRRFAPELRQTVLDKLRDQVPSSTYQQVLQFVQQADDPTQPELDSSQAAPPVMEPDPQQDAQDRADEQAAENDVTKQRADDADVEKSNATQEKSRDEDRDRKQAKEAADEKSKEKDKEPQDQAAKDEAAQGRQGAQPGAPAGAQAGSPAQPGAQAPSGAQQQPPAGAAAPRPPVAAAPQAAAAGAPAVLGAPGAQPAVGAVAAVGAPAAAGPAGAGGAPEVNDAAVDKAVEAPDSPLVRHGVVRKPGQQRHEEVPSGEEPAGLEAAATADVVEPPEPAPVPPPPQAEAAQPVDPLPKTDIDLSNVPTADQIKLPTSGTPPPPPAPPTFPAPPAPEVDPTADAKARTEEYRRSQAQDQRESPQIQQAPGQITEDAIDTEPDTAPEDTASGPEEATRPATASAARPEPAAAAAGPTVQEEPDTATEADTPTPQETSGPQREPNPADAAAPAGPGAAGPDTAGPGADSGPGTPAGPETAQAATPAAAGAAAPGAPGGAVPQDGSLEAGGGGCAGTPEQAPTQEPKGGCSAGGAGGAAPEPPKPAPPDVSTQEPKAALATIGAQPPAEMPVALGQVNSAVNHSVGQDRTQLAAAPPTMKRPSGAPRTLQGAPTEAPPVATKVARVAEAAGVEAGKQPGPEDKNVQGGPNPTDNVQTPNITGDQNGQYSREEATRIQGAVNDIPTDDPALHTTVGPAPQFELKGETDPAITDNQAKNLNTTVGQQTAVGRQDAAQQLGEDQIYPNAPAETLTAQVPGAVGGPAAAPPAAKTAGGADDVAVSVVAQQEHGPQLQAAFGRGDSSMATAQITKDKETTQAHQQNQKQVDDAIKQNTDEQASERGKAAEQVKGQRDAWRTEQDKAVADTNTKAGQQHDKAHTDIEKQRTDTNTKVQQRQESDNKDIDQKRADAEAEARKKKAEQQNSGGGGFFGWVASEVKKAFNAIVSAIKDVFNAARKLIQGVIDGFKKFVTDAIELARKAVVGLISAVATALIALGDVLLAAFPALRDKFRKLIEGLRDAAIAQVNRLANALKTAVTKLLDALGSVLSKLLDVLEKGLLAAVQSVLSAVNAVINLVKQAIAILGELASLIKDIASNPGGWIRNMASAIREGVAKFLFGSIISAVKQWFNDKIQQILGLGELIFNVLIKGCLKMGQIVSMVWGAVVNALPGMIIQLVLENVVAALIPGVGAVLKIVQTLLAAYNTISRIIAALSTFIAFLKAVKAGGTAAACKFALAVAAGAVALIEFISNFLLSKLIGAAKKVGDKLKGIATRIMNFLKRGAKAVKSFAGKAFNAAKRGAKAAWNGLKKGAGKVWNLTKRGASKLGQLAKRGWNKVKGGVKALGRRLAQTKLGKVLINAGRKIKQGYQKAKQKIADWWHKKTGKEEKPPETTEQRNQRRLNNAVARIRPKLVLLLRKGVWNIVLEAVLGGMRVWYRLSGLAKVGSPEFHIVATVNPDENVTDGVEDDSSGEKVDRDKLLPAPPAPKKAKKGEETQKKPDSEVDKEGSEAAARKPTKQKDEERESQEPSAKPVTPKGQPATEGEWPPKGPTGSKPAFGEEGADTWRYERYRKQVHDSGRGPEEVLSFEEWRKSHFEAAERGGRPGRPGGPEQVAMKRYLAENEGVQQVENVELGGRYPDGIRPNSQGGNDYFEVGEMLQSGVPEARERVKLQDQVDVLGPNDTITFVHKTDSTKRVTYRKGHKVKGPND